MLYKFEKDCKHQTFQFNGSKYSILKCFAPGMTLIQLLIFCQSCIFIPSKVLKSSYCPSDNEKAYYQGESIQLNLACYGYEVLEFRVDEKATNVRVYVGEFRNKLKGKKKNQISFRLDIQADDHSLEIIDDNIVLSSVNHPDIDYNLQWNKTFPNYTYLLFNGKLEKGLSFKRFKVYTQNDLIKISNIKYLNHEQDTVALAPIHVRLSSDCSSIIKLR